jgi:hypothetical protein
MNEWLKNEAPKVKYPEVAQALERMRIEDQNMRTTLKWDHELDPRNVQEVKKIIERIGWPTVSKVGVEASEDAWLLVQHADHDPAFQAECLKLMKKEPAGEVNPRNLGYLEDRIHVNTGRPQLYGTQMTETWDDEGNVIDYQPQPIEDPEHIDERRAALGMEPYKQYVEGITREYCPHFLPDSSKE